MKRTTYVENHPDGVRVLQFVELSSKDKFGNRQQQSQSVILTVADIRTMYIMCFPETK